MPWLDENIGNRQLSVSFKWNCRPILHCKRREKSLETNIQVITLNYLIMEIDWYRRSARTARSHISKSDEIVVPKAILCEHQPLQCPISSVVSLKTSAMSVFRKVKDFPPFDSIPSENSLLTLFPFPRLYKTYLRNTSYFFRDDTNWNRVPNLCNDFCHFLGIIRFGEFSPCTRVQGRKKGYFSREILLNFQMFLSAECLNVFLGSEKVCSLLTLGW